MVNLLEERAYQEIRTAMAFCSRTLPDNLAIDSEILVYGGIDATPEAVFRQREAIFRDEYEKNKASQAQPSFLAYWGNEVVWCGTEVVAVMVPRRWFDAEARVKGAEAGLTVYRFDDPYCFRVRGRVWDGTDEGPQPDEDVEDDDEDEG
jgi:hypothetical protein